MASSDNDFCIDCAVDCTTDPPVLQCDSCNIETEFGQIEMIYITNIGNPIIDPADFIARVDNSATADPAAIRALCVKGQKPAPDVTEVELSCDVIAVTNRTHTLDLTVDRLNTINYEALRKIQCSPRYLIWYSFRGQKNLYGALTGIVANNLAHFESAGDGKGDLFLGKILSKWDSLCDPDFIVHPQPGIGCS